MPVSVAAVQATDSNFQSVARPTKFTSIGKHPARQIAADAREP